MCHGTSPGHLQRRTPPRLCDPPCSEKQAGIGPISQKPELVTMGLNYDDALDRTSFRQGAASSRLFIWLPPHGGVRPSSGRRSIFLNGALFSKTIFYFFGK
jgi:hypothetical protein